MSVKRILEQERYQKTGSESELYSDFLQSFLPHPNTGSITRKVNVDSVKMAIRNLLLTNKYERLRNPKYGANITRNLFENFSPSVVRRIKEDIESAVETFEPRVRVIDTKVTASEDENRLFVQIIFAVATVQEPQSVDITLYRVR
jgi:phage baseplate assembly protein W